MKPTTDYIAAYNPAPGRDPRGKTHAARHGAPVAACSLKLHVEPRTPLRAFDPSDDDACVSCARVTRGLVPGQRKQQEDHDQAKRAKLLEDDDRCVRAFMLALHTGGLNNSRGNNERSTNTMESYYVTINALRRMTGGKRWDDISPDEIHACVNRPTSTGPRAHKTIIQNITALSTFYNFLIERELIEGRSPMRHVGRPRETEETGSLTSVRLPAPQEAWTTVQGSQLSIDDRLLLGFCYFAGLRISEAVIVRPDRVNPLGREMEFWRPKSRKWQLDFAYGAYVEALQMRQPDRAVGAEEWLEIVEWMVKYRRNEDTLLASGSSIEPEQWWTDRLEHHILPDAGLDPKAFTPHRLRHNFGHNMIDCGIELPELQEAMGHQSLETTMAYAKNAKRASKFLDRLRAEDEAAAGDVVAFRNRRRRSQG